MLERIRAEPYETAPRLACAHWLEERSDRRADCIRLE